MMKCAHNFSSSCAPTQQRVPGAPAPLTRCAAGVKSFRAHKLTGLSNTAPHRISRSPLTCNAKGGSGVLDNPTVTKDPAKQSKGKRPPTYKVMLHNDPVNRREYVVKTLLKVVKGITAEDASTAMRVAHESGVAMVTQCPQDEAEQYCQGLRLNGLTSSIEPGC